MWQERVVDLILFRPKKYGGIVTSRAYEEQQRAMTLIMVADSGEKEEGKKNHFSARGVCLALKRNKEEKINLPRTTTHLFLSLFLPLSLSLSVICLVWE